MTCEANNKANDEQSNDEQRRATDERRQRVKSQNEENSGRGRKGGEERNVESRLNGNPTFLISSGWTYKRDHPLADETAKDLVSLPVTGCVNRKKIKGG